MQLPERAGQGGGGFSVTHNDTDTFTPGRLWEMPQHHLDGHVGPRTPIDVPSLQDPHGVQFFTCVIFVHRDFHFGLLVEFDESDPGFSGTQVKLADEESERVPLLFQLFILDASRNVDQEENIQRFLCAFCNKPI